MIGEKLAKYFYFTYSRMKVCRIKLIIKLSNRKEVKNMDLKYVIPNVNKTFGNLEYAGEGNVEQRRVNGRNTIYIQIFKEQMILLLFFQLKQAKSILKLKKE